ncbi:unnamed protein product [Cochlearia groenlandica]
MRAQRKQRWSSRELEEDKEEEWSSRSVELSKPLEQTAGEDVEEFIADDNTSGRQIAKDKPLEATRGVLKKTKPALKTTEPNCWKRHEEDASWRPPQRSPNRWVKPLDPARFIYFTLVDRFFPG